MNQRRVILPTAASFLITENCNLRCTYCFEKHNTKTMSIKVAKDGLDYLANNAKLSGAENFSAMLFGGEPTLHPDVVEAILSYGLELSNKYNVPFSASMVTNATNLPDELITVIEKYGPATQLSVQLSVDGIQEVQDMFRVTVGGKGSFHMVEKNIPKWKELFKNMPGALSIHGCSNKQTLPYLFENYKFFKDEWGFDNIWFMPIHGEDWTVEDVEIYREQLTMIMDDLLERTRISNNLYHVEGYAPLDKCSRHDGWANAPCSAGKTFVTITADGEIYPCHHFYFNDPENATKLGDIYKGVDQHAQQIYIDYDYTSMSCTKECPDCDAYGCYRCIAENWVVNGSMLSQIRGHRCDMSKVERELQVYLREKLSDMGLLSINRKSCGSCDCGGSCGEETKEVSIFEDTVILALHEIINRLDSIEERLSKLT